MPACALSDRKGVLDLLIGGLKGGLRYSEHVEGDNKAIYQNACILVDRRDCLEDSRYSPGRSASWSKVTCRTRDTFVIAGIAYNRNKFDGIYLARRKEGGLLYAERSRTALRRHHSATWRRGQRSRSQPLTKKIRKPKAQWLKPERLVDVKYRAATGEGKVRHPSFEGLREEL
ncbi:MAG TPA: hypothetical protein VGI93_15145 [Steroidobacteraceae bacterium]